MNFFIEICFGSITFHLCSAVFWIEPQYAVKVSDEYGWFGIFHLSRACSNSCLNCQVIPWKHSIYSESNSAKVPWGKGEKRASCSFKRLETTILERKTNCVVKSLFGNDSELGIYEHICYVVFSLFAPVLKHGLRSHSFVHVEIFK